MLFYGGCHASALRQLFDQYAKGGIETDSIINFRLIQTQQPFPYERLKNYDAVVFSPIYREGPYNTSHLIEACRQRGVKTVSFPWLEWRGYWPMATKSETGWGSFWTTKLLLEMARSARSLDELEDLAFDERAVGDATDRGLDNAISMFRFREREANVDISLSEFFLTEFRNQRLMLTPDHATNAVYRVLVPSIAERLSLPIHRSFQLFTGEVQHGITLPILPAVAKHLGLSFPAGDMLHVPFIGDQLMPFRTYLKLYFLQASVVRFRAQKDTRIIGTAGEVTPVPKGTVFLGRMIGTAYPHELVDVIFDVRCKVQDEVRVYLPHWQVAPFALPAGGAAAPPLEVTSPADDVLSEVTAA